MGAKATRRELVRGGIGLAGSLGAWRVADALAAAPARTQSQVLGYALRMERLAVIVYRQALASNVLAPAVRSQLEVLLSDEQRHVAKLEQILERLGGPVPSGPDGVRAAQALLTRHQIHRSISNLPNQHDVLRVLIDTESLTEGAYFKAMPALVDAGLIRTSAEIMGSDAQHWTILSNIQHHGDLTVSVPYPFVQGSP